jgi:sugar phosphate isomerase/epimerase
MKTLKLIFVLLFGSSMLISCSMEKYSRKNIGLQMYSLRDLINDETIGIDSVIRMIGKQGYKYIEAADYYNGTIYGMSPVSFKEKIEEAGLIPLSCHVRQDKTDDMSTMWNWWDLCIATHKAAGMSYIVQPSMPVPETLEELQAYCDYFNRIGEKCNAVGMKFGYHNHSYEFEKIYSDGTAMYDYMIQHTDPEKVFFELDVYWCQKGGRLATQLFEAYPKRFLLLHIKDEEELGKSGFMNFEDLFKTIDKAGTKYLIVEVEKYNMPPAESVKQSLDYLNSASFVKNDYSK